MDVYSYDVLALEVACGLRVIELSFDLMEEWVMLNWVWSEARERHTNEGDWIHGWR